MKLSPFAILIATNCYPQNDNWCLLFGHLIGSFINMFSHQDLCLEICQKWRNIITGESAMSTLQYFF